MFKLQGNKIINEKGKSLEVAGGIDKENQNIIINNNQNVIHQDWNIVYVDED